MLKNKNEREWGKVLQRSQIVDVELEKNGIYTYDRERKFDMNRIKKIFSKSREQAKKEVVDMLKKH